LNSSSSFELVVDTTCLATLGLRAGVEQPFDCLIIQNHQAMQFTGRSMDWTLEDNMVDGLFFCTTLTGCRGGPTPFVQAGAECLTPVRRQLSQTHAILRRVILGGGCWCRG